MLYNSFRVTIMFTAAIGVLHMIAMGSYVYILFPIAIIIWGIYSFFDENDKEYLRRNGIDADEVPWFFPDYTDYGAVRSKSPSRSYSHKSHNRYSYNGSVNVDEQYSRYMPKKDVYNTEYEALKNKCKRNFKITIAEKDNGEEL